MKATVVPAPPQPKPLPEVVIRMSLEQARALHNEAYAATSNSYVKYFTLNRLIDVLTEAHVQTAT